MEDLLASSYPEVLTFQSKYRCTVPCMLLYAGVLWVYCTMCAAVCWCTVPCMLLYAGVLWVYCTMCAAVCWCTVGVLYHVCCCMLVYRGCTLPLCTAVCWCTVPLCAAVCWCTVGVLCHVCCCMLVYCGCTVPCVLLYADVHAGIDHF